MNHSEYKNAIPLSLLILVSFFLHFTMFFTVSLPELKRLPSIDDILSADGDGRPKFIAANINQDDRRQISRRTLLSDRDSTEKGYITKTRGETWYSGSSDINLSAAGQGKGRSSVRSSEMRKYSVIQSDESAMTMSIVKPEEIDRSGDGSAGKLVIPDSSQVSRSNSLYYSSSGQFSLNTVKFKHYEFAKQIVDKIRSNWYPPIMANVAIGGYGAGAVRVRAIPPQDVKTYFVLNRSGDVLSYGIIDSYGNRSLDDACLDSIRMSKNFGRVPDDIKGDRVLIPFIFIYR